MGTRFRSAAPQDAAGDVAFAHITGGSQKPVASNRAARHPAMRFSGGATVAAAAFITPATVV